LAIAGEQVHVAALEVAVDHALLLVRKKQQVEIALFVRGYPGDFHL